MEIIGILLGLILVGLLFALPVIAVVFAARARGVGNKTEKQLALLVGRVQALEQQVMKLIRLTAHLEATAAEVAPSAAPPPPAKAAPPPQVPRAAPPPPVVHPPALAAERPAPPVAPPRFTTQPPPGPSTGERLKSILNIEEALGTNWLNKLGVIILVVGVALFLVYELRAMGHGGKIFVGYVVSLAFLGAGVFFEGRERWCILARAAIGGGWALTFFTTYAMRHIEASRLEPVSETADLFLLLLVGAGMVSHSLKYRSQVVTGLAFLLAFSTINIVHVPRESLFANAVLAAGVAGIAVRRRWFELEVFAVLAAYLNHLYWLYPIILKMGAHRHPTPELDASTTLLIFYWLVFRASYILRRVEEPHQENVSTLAALLNTFLFQSLIAYQSARPEMAFKFLLSVGIVEMVLAQLPITRRRRAAFLILSTIGATLLVAAFAYKYSEGSLTAVWLLEAESLFLAGVFTREIHFRRLGMLASVALTGQILFNDVVHLARLRDQLAYDFSDPRLALVVAIAASALYANAHWVPRRWPELIKTDFEVLCFRALSYLAAFMALVGIWAVCTEPWLAVGLTALALMMAFAGCKWKIREVSVQAIGFALLGFIRVLVDNFRLDCAIHHISLRVATVPLVIALLYMASRWAGIAEAAETSQVSAAFTWLASFLVSLLVWYELEPAGVVLGWTLLGLILFELGLARRAVSLRLQAYVAIAAGFLRIFFVNLNAEAYPGELSPRVYTTVPLVLACYYVCGRLQRRTEDFLKLDIQLKAAEFHSTLGVLSLAGLMRFELPADWVIVAWAGLAFALLAVALKPGQKVFLHQGQLVAFAVLFRGVLHNLYQRSYFPPPFWLKPVFSVGVTVALLFLALSLAFRQREQGAVVSERKRNWLARSAAAVGRHPEQVFFFIPFFLLVALLALEVPSGLVTVAWGIAAVCVFIFALWVGQRSYRLSGLGLLLLCVAKIVFRDVWGLQPRDRYLTFIFLGAALLGVSFLYTRYRETIRHYL